MFKKRAMLTETNSAIPWNPFSGPYPWPKRVKIEYVRTAPIGVEAANKATCVRILLRGIDVASKDVVNANAAGAAMEKATY